MIQEIRAEEVAGKVWLVFAAVMVLLMFVAVGPAAAAESGTGAFAGLFEYDAHQTADPADICAENEQTVMTLVDNGTWTADDGNVIYAGPATITVESTATFYEGPNGTHGTTDDECTTATVGTTVPISATVNSPAEVASTLGSVNCNEAAGDYSRNTLLSAEPVTTVWETDCMVTSAAGLQDTAGVTITLKGVLTGCLGVTADATYRCTYEGVRTEE